MSAGRTSDGLRMANSRTQLGPGSETLPCRASSTGGEERTRRPEGFPGRRGGRSETTMFVKAPSGIPRSRTALGSIERRHVVTLMPRRASEEGPREECSFWTIDSHLWSISQCPRYGYLNSAYPVPYLKSTVSHSLGPLRSKNDRIDMIQSLPRPPRAFIYISAPRQIIKPIQSMMAP